MFLFSNFLLVTFAFAMGIIDASTGMGYGTILTPILLILGYDIINVVPAVLISQLAGNFLAAFFHHKYENVNLSRNSPDFKIAITLSLFSIIGSAFSVIVVNILPSFFINLYIGILLSAIGFFIIATKKTEYSFSWIRLLGLGSLAAFNKGISGGGYGPILTIGQIMTGIKLKKIIGIISLTEGITCIAALLMYFVFGTNLDWILSICLSIGVIFSAPIAAFFVRKIKDERLKIIIGIFTFSLGLITIIKIFYQI